MKNKRFTAKILIDIGMTVCLLLLMAYSLLRDRKSTRLNSSHANESRMPSSA